MNEAYRKVPVEGFLLGVIGYTAVAAGYLVMDLAAGHPLFHTAALLGQGIFGSLSGDAAAAVITPGPILAFNGLHLVAFLIMGTAIATLLHEAEAHPRFWYLAFFVLLAVLIYGYALALVAAEAASVQLPLWSIVLADLFSAAAMVGYLAARHRGLAQRLDRWGDPEAQPALTHPGFNHIREDQP